MKKFLLAIFVIFISGTAFYFSTGFQDTWWLMWIAPIPVLIYAYRESFLKTLCVAFMASLALGLNDIVGYWPTFLPVSDFISGALWQSTEWTIVILFSRYLMKKIMSPWNIFAYPVCFAFIEWLESFTIQGTFTTIAYSQLSVLPVIQLASLTGYLGVTFILSVFASTLTCTILSWQEKKKALSTLTVGLIIILATLAYGYTRLHTFKERAPVAQLKVGLVSVSRAPKQIFNPTFAHEIFSAYQPLMERLAAQHIELILLPEEAFTVTPETTPYYKNWFAHFAAQRHLKLILGVHDQQASATYNAAWVFDDQGNWVGEYHKRHFVPGVEEGLTPGTALFNFEMKGNKAGIGICRDMDYLHPAQDYGALGTQILFVPAWDFNVDAKVHASGAWLEGIQNGYTLVRAARDGFLSVSTPTEEILAQVLAISAQGTTLIATAPIYENQSFHAKHPWWFVILLWLLFLIIVFRARDTTNSAH